MSKSNMKLNANNLGLAGATVSGASMILLTILNSMGLYQNAVLGMQDLHMFYAPTFGGTILGLIEAAVITYIYIYALVWVYNKFQK